MGNNQSYIPPVSEYTANIISKNSIFFDFECKGMYKSFLTDLTNNNSNIIYRSERRDLLTCPQVKEFKQNGYHVHKDPREYMYHLYPER